jgi:hypothetical protein
MSDVELLRLAPLLGKASLTLLQEGKGDERTWRLDREASIPIVELLCDFLASNAPWTEGVLRVCGSCDVETALLLLLRKRVNCVTERTLHSAGTHVVAGALKTVLRRQVIPLFDVPVVSGPSVTPSSVIASLSNDPSGYKIVQRVVLLCHDLLPYQNITLMSVDAMATCLMPNLVSASLYSHVHLLDAVTLAQVASNIFASIIENYSTHFPLPYERVSTALLQQSKVQPSFLLREREWTSIFRAANGTKRSVQPGETLIVEGQVNTTLSRVIDGTFDVVVNGNVVATHSTGDLIGEMSLFSVDSHAAASVVCTTAATIWSMPNNAINTLRTSDPLTASRLFASVATTLASRLYVTMLGHHSLPVPKPAAVRTPLSPVKSLSIVGKMHPVAYRYLCLMIFCQHCNVLKQPQNI